MTTVVFTTHAAWRTAERHGSSVCLDRLELEIAAAVDGGWSSESLDWGGFIVHTRSGDAFIVKRGSGEGEVIVVTALGRKSSTY